MSRSRQRFWRALGFTTSIGALAATAALAAPGRHPGPPGHPHATASFINGVTAGEITEDGAIIWGQTSTEVNVRAEVATDAAFQNVVTKRMLRAKRKNDNTVQATVKHLDAGQTYHYRFCVPARCSDEGAFETAPPASENRTIRFAYSGDETGIVEKGQTTPAHGDMKAFRSMAAENNDFNIDIGDTMYSDPEVPFPVSDALTVEEKWSRYRDKLAVANQRAVRAATGIYNHWDDHEFIDNYSKEENGMPLYEAGVKAFRDYMPVTYSKHDGIYRSFRWGKNLELFFLDERSFRSATADAGASCDLPHPSPGGLKTDPLPTAPPSIRNLFAGLVPDLGKPASPACLETINSPDRTLLGARQFNRFLHDVKSSTATWKVVMHADPLQQIYVDPYDQWEGYAYERIQLLKALTAANIDHLVFLTTSRHAALANVVRYRTLAGESAPANAPAGSPPIDTPYREFVIGPVATLPFWGQIDARTTDGIGQAISLGVFKPPPPGGLGMACARGDVFSYAEVTVTEEELSVAYKNEDGGIVKDADLTTPCGPYVLTD